MARSGSVLARRDARLLRRRNFVDRSFKARFEPLEGRVMLSIQPFIGGDIVVYRVGDGSKALSNSGDPIFLDEYSPSGVLVQSIEMPFSINPDDRYGGIPSPPGAPNPIVTSGSSATSGELNLSVDRRYLTFTGYVVNLPSGAPGGSSLKSSGTPRGAARIDINGTLDTSTVLTNYSVLNTPSGALTVDGSGYYLFSKQIDGIRYAALGSTSSTPVSDTSNPALTKFGSMQVYNGQLYASTGSAIYHIGTDLPTTSGQAVTALSGVTGLNSKSDNFFFVTLDPASHGTQPDTLYVADPTTGGGRIVKFSATTFDGSGTPTAWAQRGFVSVNTVTGLTGYANGSSVVMFATNGASIADAGTWGGALFTFKDTSGYNTSIPGGAAATTLVASVPFNQGFRELAFAPNQAPTLASGNSTLPAIVENVSSANNTGRLVSDVIAGLGGSPIGDTAGSHQGIAITETDSVHGTWQFSLNGGGTWQTFPAVSSTLALTLVANSATKIRFTPAANYNGNATLTFRAWDQSQGNNGGTFSIITTGGTSPFSGTTATASQTVTFVNQAPSFVRGASQSILNTAGAQSVANWATNISPGPSAAGSQVPESTQAIDFIVSNNNNALFAVQPSISANGTLSYTPASAADGIATVTVQLHDDGGMDSGGHNTSAAQTFQIALTPVGGNQPPVNAIPFVTQTTLQNQPLTFSIGNNNAISVSDPDAGANPIQIMLAVTNGAATLNNPNALTLISGANGSASMTYQGTIADINAALAGLIYTPTTNINGSAAGLLSLTSNDLGNTGNGGAKSSTDSITIDITPVNQAPSFIAGGNVTVPAFGSYSNTWATAVSAGPPNESTQTVAFLVSNNNSAIFTVQPSISPTGVLSFTPVLGLGGTATVTVQLQDSGGTANGGVDTSAPQNFLIQLSPVDLPPVNTVPGGQRLIKDTPLIFSVGTSNGISVADPDGFGSTEQVTLTATHGTLTLPAGTFITSGSSTTKVLVTVGTGTNDTSMTFKGTLININTALNGLVFTPASGYTGGASITMATNDLSAVSPGPLTTNSTVNITIVTAPPLVISEILINPDGLDRPNQYIEIRSATPNYTIPNGTYLVSVSGNVLSVTLGQTVTSFPAGSVVDVFDLSGVTTGSNGYLVLLQNGNTYNNYEDFGGLGLVDPHAAVLDNGINPDGSIAFGTGAGYGNNDPTYGYPGSSIVGHSALFRANDVDYLKGSATYMLISTPGSVHPGDSLDSPLGVAPTGSLHGTEYDGWTVYDSIGTTLQTLSAGGDVSYGFVNYVNTAPGTTNHATPDSTVITTSFSVDHFARNNNNSGWVASDWSGSSGVAGLVPTWGTGSNNNTTPSVNGQRPLNNIGSANFDMSQPAVVTTTPGTVNYPIGSGDVVVDPNVTVADPDSFFLGSAKVQISSGFNASTDTLAFAGAPFITGTFDATTGTLSLKGYDTFGNWIAALQSVTFNYSGSVVANPSRSITFMANDGAVLSNQATRLINIQGPVVSPPIVSGTSATPLDWTEILPPTLAPVIAIAPSLSIIDGSATDLTSATVAISANFSSSQDVLGWDDTVATSNGITVTYTPGKNKLTLAPTLPATSASLASFEAVLRTVTYSNSSQNPTAVARTVTFTVVDINSITSSITTNSQQVINVTAVNNPPTVTTSAGSDAYTASAAAILVDGALTVTDPDNATLTGATISITGGFAAGDTLGFINQAGVSGSYDAVNGVLTLTGSSLPHDYQIALRAVTFSTSSGGTRTISFAATDGLATSAVATKQIDVSTVIQLTVVNTNDSGAGSFRQAILNANSDPGNLHTIEFAIPGAGPHSIQLISMLPTIADPVSLNMDPGEAIEVGTFSVYTFGDYADMSKIGGGSLTIGGNQTHTYASVLHVLAGELDLVSDAGTFVSLSAVNSGTTVNLDVTQHLASVSASGGAMIVLTAVPPGSPPPYVTGDKFVRTKSLSITGTSKFDLGNGALIVDYTGNPSPLGLFVPQSGISGYVKSAFNDFAWDGPGLGSSLAQTDPQQLTAVGILDNANWGYTVLNGVDPHYDGIGEPLPAESILVKYTYYGDADLDGLVTTADFDAWLTGKNQNLQGWDNGDFDYDGFVTTGDFDLWLTSKNQQSGPLSPMGVGPVPVSPAAALPTAAVSMAFGSLAQNDGPQSTARPSIDHADTADLLEDELLDLLVNNDE